jgi:hypothetical protein
MRPAATAVAGQAAVAPPLAAYPRLDGLAGLRVWCVHCRIWHLHGGYGHRVAHCHRPSPYRATGYVLVPPPQSPARTP